MLSIIPELSKKVSGWPWTEETDPSVYDSKRDWPKISIITPSYNQGKYIEETIRSVLLQNYPNLEYIIIDGGSTDNTIDILKKYDKWITYWVSEPDNGQSSAINKGINKASGEIFNWLNSDDYYAPKALYEVGTHFSTKEIDALCGYCVTFDNTTYKVKNLSRMEINETTEESIVYHKINQPSTFLKLTNVINVGGINESLKYVMDLELWIKILLRKGQDKITKTDSVLAYFRHHDLSKSTMYFQRFMEEEYAVYLSLAKQIIPFSNITKHLETLTKITLNNNWQLSKEFSPQFYEKVFKKRFYPILYKKYYQERDYINSKSIFKEYLRTFKPSINFSLMISFLKIMVIPAFLGNFLRDIKKRLMSKYGKNLLAKKLLDWTSHQM